MAQPRIPLVMIGAGGFAAILHEILSARPDVTLLGCTDKALGVSERSLDEGVTLKILGDDDIIPQLADKHRGLRAVFALGPDLMETRARLMRTLEAQNILFLSVIHASAVISSLAKIGEGTVIREGATVSASAEIGPCGLLNLGASIDHDAKLARNVYVGQGAKISSHVQIGPNVVIEMGASVNSRVTVGQGARVTGGAFVNSDIPDHAVVVGVPARVVRFIDQP